jgi:putative transposase
MCPPDGGRDTSHRALQRHRASNSSVDLAAASRSDSSDHSYRFLIHDRDSIFSAELDQQLKAFGLRVLRTPARAPKANAYCERLVGSIRRECLDFMIPLGEKHLRRILAEWVTHYNQGRPHLSLGPGIPEPATVFLPVQGHDRHSFAQDCKVAARAVLGGLHHEYRWERIAA